ncbi:hypothetical protein C8R44DRAFT_737105 [Mycena epipterygia]|nr:hypothetical protein C8R44DRAFT_737105 [Mycena epipterygia]
MTPLTNEEPSRTAASKNSMACSAGNSTSSCRYLPHPPIALMLFALALAIYLGMIHHTSLTTLLIKRTLHHEPLRALSRSGISPLRSVLSRAWPTGKPLRLPFFNTKPSKPDPIFDSPDTSKQLSAFVWALQTTTDPKVVETLAVMISDLQWWPGVSMATMFVVVWVRAHSAASRHLVYSNWLPASAKSHPTCGLPPRAGSDHELISAVIFFPFVRSKDSFWTPSCGMKSVITQFFPKARIPSPLTQWTLRFISGQHLPEIHSPIVLSCFKSDEAGYSDVTLLADFLFCINSFFVAPVVRDVSVMDKSKYCDLLTKLLFENLSNRLRAANLLDHKITGDIVDRVAQFSAHVAKYAPGENDECREAVTAPDTVGDFLHGPGTPSTTLLRAILWALSPDTQSIGLTDDIAGQLRALAFSVLCAAEPWFRHEELQQVLLEYAVWDSLGAYTKEDADVRSYVAMGSKLSYISAWEGAIREDLPSWLQSLKLLLDPTEDVDEKLTQAVDADEGARFGEEKTLVMSFTALATIWDEFDFSDAWGIHRVLPLLQCTVVTAFHARLVQKDMFSKGVVGPSEAFRDVVIGRLGDALVRAVARAEQAAHHPDEVLSGACVLLSKISSVISGVLRTGAPPCEGADCGERDAKVQYWEDLEKSLNDELDVLRNGAPLSGADGGQRDAEVQNSEDFDDKLEAIAGLLEKMPLAHEVLL